MLTHIDPHTNTLFRLDGPTLYNAIRVRFFHHHHNLSVFLGYHGFTNSGGLRAYPTSNYNRPELAGDFKVAVSLHPEMLPGHENKTYFARDFTEPTERALGWVLWTLFAHSPDIGLELKEGYPAFW